MVCLPISWQNPDELPILVLATAMLMSRIWQVRYTPEIDEIVEVLLPSDHPFCLIVFSCFFHCKPCLWTLPHLDILSFMTFER